MNLSKNFTLEEMIFSQTAIDNNIDNTPNKKETLKLTMLCKNILQPIRDKYGDVVYVSSGFRCEELNNLVGGSPNSQHKFGEAADIHTKSDTARDNKALFYLIKEMIESGEIHVGQLINEHNFNWIHISLPNINHHNQIISLN